MSASSRINFDKIKSADSSLRLKQIDSRRK